MTAFCGVAQAFWQLILFRVGVGVGEEDSLPASQSRLVDYFPPQQRAFALAIFTSATTIGYVFAFIGGTSIVTQFGWRWTLIAMALPGLLIAHVTTGGLREARATLGFPRATGGTTDNPESAQRTLGHFGASAATSIRHLLHSVVLLCLRSHTVRTGTLDARIECVSQVHRSSVWGR